MDQTRSSWKWILSHSCITIIPALKPERRCSWIRLKSLRPYEKGGIAYMRMKPGSLLRALTERCTTSFFNSGQEVIALNYSYLT